MRRAPGLLVRSAPSADGGGERLGVQALLTLLVRPSRVCRAKVFASYHPTALEDHAFIEEARQRDGSAMDVDPGEHTLVVSVRDQQPVTKSFRIREGDKARRERVTVGATSGCPRGTHVEVGSECQDRSARVCCVANAEAAAPDSVPAPSADAAVDTTDWSFISRWSGVAAIGAGVVGLVLVATANGSISSHCTADKHCDQQGLDATGRGKGGAWLADIGLPVGAVLFGLSFALPDGSHKSSRSGILGLPVVGAVMPR